MMYAEDEKRFMHIHFQNNGYYAERENCPADKYIQRTWSGLYSYSMDADPAQYPSGWLMPNTLTCDRFAALFKLFWDEIRSNNVSTRTCASA